MVDNFFFFLNFYTIIIEIWKSSFWDTQHCSIREIESFSAESGGFPHGFILYKLLSIYSITIIPVPHTPHTIMTTIVYKVRACRRACVRINMGSGFPSPIFSHPVDRPRVHNSGPPDAATCILYNDIVCTWCDKRAAVYNI